MKTSDEERDLVLRQNEMLRGAEQGAKGPHFQRLRRCCICLMSSCADLSACRSEFARWAEKKWDTAIGNTDQRYCSERDHA